MKHRLIIILSFLTILFPAWSSYFRNYQMEHGLSHNSVWTVMQDSYGFMWFGTNDGLNRFDGKNFKVFKKSREDSLSIGHNFIHCIKEISDNRLLIGTRGGLFLFNRENENFTPVSLEDNQKTEININDIMQDQYGNVWVASHGKGLYKLNPDLTTEKHFITRGDSQDLSSNFIWTIITDHYGNLWLGTAGKGLIHIDPRNDQVTNITNRKNLEIADQSVYSIYCDNDNSLWIGTSTKGLFKYNYIKDEVSHYLRNTGSIKSIQQYSEHELIMGSDKGLIIFDKTSEKHVIVKNENYHNNISDNSIFAIAQDYEGAFWIGTYFEGVNYFSPGLNNFVHFNNFSKKTFQKQVISSMVEEEDGNILVATHNSNIIYRFNPSDREVKKAFELEHHNILSLFRDGNKLYVSIYGRGVNVLSLPDGKELNRINIRAIEGNSIFKDSKGGILFALEEGGCTYVYPDGTIKRLDKLSGALVADIAEDKQGNIWFATHAYGLFCLTSGGNWEVFSKNEDNSSSFTSNMLSCIISDRDNRLWIGTKNEGIILFDPENRAVEQVIDTSTGILSNSIYSILEDKEKNKWVSTRNGIVRITNNSWEIHNFGYIGKEIQYNSKCAFVTSTGILHFGGVDGVICLNPQQLILNEHAPNVVLTAFKIANKEVTARQTNSPLNKALEVSKEINLKWDEANFSFDFSSLSFIFPEANQYAYQLEGFDKEWNYTNDNTAHYMNLPAGKYLFRVKGSNNDGKWSESDTRIQIKITPPWWREQYMLLLYAILFMIVVLYCVQQYHNYIEAKNKEKQYKYKVVKEKEMYESKINFFTNIAHEIRTPLSLITAPLESILVSGDGNEKTRKNLKAIEQSTNRLLDLVNQLLDFRKIESNMFLLHIRRQSINKIVQKVYDQYARDAVMNHIEISIHAPDEVTADVDPEALYKIISNLFSNAIKFARSKIEVQLTTRDNYFSLSVKDDGIGVREIYHEKIFEPFYQVQVTEHIVNQGSGLGLSLSKSLAQKHKGDLRIESEHGTGSTFILSLPLVNDTETALVSDEIKPEKTDIYLSDIEPAKGDSTVLIVEDNNDLRTFVRDALAEHYTVLEAENGVKALEVLEKNKVDIILADIVMPEMDGLELCNSIKSDLAYSHLPFILLSAKTDTLTKIDGLKKGADVYMEKPFSIEQLKAQIASVFDNRRNIHKNFIQSPLQYFKQNKDTEENEEFIKKLNAFIIENMANENFSIENMTNAFAISRTNFHNKIKSITGVTPNEYIKLIRLNKSAELLATGKYRINEVCFAVGFNSSSYFAKCFYEHFGKLPKDLYKS